MFNNTKGEKEMKKLLLIAVCVMLMGCSANPYMLSKIDSHDVALRSVAKEINVMRENFKVIDAQYTTKKMVEDVKTECPACKCVCGQADCPTCVCDLSEDEPEFYQGGQF